MTSAWIDTKIEGFIDHDERAAMEAVIAAARQMAKDYALLTPASHVGYALARLDAIRGNA